MYSYKESFFNLALISIRYKLTLLANTIYYLLRYKNDFLLINCWVCQRFGRLEHRNLGDELNIFLLEELSGKKVVCSQEVLLNHRVNYLGIGSLIESKTRRKTIIWGSGAIEGEPRKLFCKPLKVCATRGKLSREYLMRNGVECPEVYGDPALLLPEVYNPSLVKKYKYGIIPHYSEWNNENVNKLQSQLGDECILISMKNYKNWHDVIDLIISCRFIVSSSLHGLIISDTYGIPNVWIKITDDVVGGNFKYLDYFSGVNRNTNQPININDINASNIDSYFDTYKPISFDVNKLKGACPFKIRPNYG